uniref:Uncharacterized protein n=1 Tax=Romanomermis culicivorax TaxID=13658 RepID=A0A915L9I3_ROMCU
MLYVQDPDSAGSVVLDPDSHPHKSGPDASNFLDLDLDPDMDTMKQDGSDVVKKWIRPVYTNALIQ